MGAIILGTCFFCISASVRRASVREEAFLDREARCEGAKRFFIVKSISTDRPLEPNPMRSARHSRWSSGGVGLMTVRPTTHP